MLPPTNYHWEDEDGHYRPVPCIKLPAPVDLPELRKCSCKSGCKRKSCNCVGNNLRCNDMCSGSETCKTNLEDQPLDVDDADKI